MAELAFALRYGAVTLASEVVPTAVGPGSAFVSLDHPPPVGCALELHAADVVLPATVSRVVEAVKGREQRAGVWIRLGDLEAEAAALWQPLVEGDDPVFPEPGDSRPERSVVGSSEDHQGSVEVGDVRGDASDHPGGSSTDSDTGPRKGDSSHEPVDDGRKTEIMTAVSVEGSIEDGAVQDASAESEEKTRPISEIEAQPPKPRGKKKRRKRRKTR